MTGLCRRRPLCSESRYTIRTLAITLLSLPSSVCIEKGMSWVITYTTDELHFLTWTMYFSLSYCTSDSYCSCRHLQPRYPRYNDECPIFNPHHTVYRLPLSLVDRRAARLYSYPTRFINLRFAAFLTINPRFSFRHCLFFHDPLYH